MAAPLTIDNFEFDKLRAKSSETKRGGNVTYYSIPFEYEDSKSLLKVEGNFRVFRHENKEGISYSLAIGIDDENEEFFTKLGERIAELAYEQKGKIPKSFKPSDLELVKAAANGKYKNAYNNNNNNNTIFIQVTSVQLMKAAINMGPVDVERPSLKIKNLQ